MTTKELSQLRWLYREIEMNKRELEKLEVMTTFPAAQNINSGSGERVQCVEEIAGLKAAILAKQQQCIHERNRLERYIAGIPNSLTRQMFQLYFIGGLTWQQAALSLGGRNTEASVKKCVYRYLKSAES